LKSLSIIVPTPDGGRLDLLAKSLVGQLRPEDEVVVVGDTHGTQLPGVRDWVTHQPGWRWMEHDAGRHAWGHPQMNYGMAHARGDYLVVQDDDDIFAPDALTNIRRAVRHIDPPRPHLFRFKAGRFGGQAFWVTKGVVAQGMIGGHCLVTPNIPEKTGKWTDRYEGDFDFIVETLRLWEPLEPVWRPEVITFAR
jgi:glycosyltransferase involved in cell wall biosynthesis